jgi:hypothetical protein
MNHGQLFGHERGSLCADVSEVWQDAEKSEGTYKTPDGRDFVDTLRKLAERFPQ